MPGGPVRIGRAQPTGQRQVCAHAYRFRIREGACGSQRLTWASAGYLPAVLVGNSGFTIEEGAGGTTLRRCAARASWFLRGGLGTGGFAETNLTSEVFYRLAITPNFAVTPVYQFIISPSLNPGVDTLSVLSFRARLAF
ncbi:carbohydrate porin [Sandaracinobacter neustonicus]|uniref:Carbohydrate porin n=1 Tax=Sandaracinobacter neustonicus TaxID=1715348 RepID=A0A501XTM9_9SPHN|nr:carbohydrate porin [Sandaracinobacter neustonicus]TPE63926.1 carbohydrate porin [Sandaracinobacter neustonicus]